MCPVVSTETRPFRVYTVNNPEGTGNGRTWHAPRTNLGAETVLCSATWKPLPATLCFSDWGTPGNDAETTFLRLTLARWESWALCLPQGYLGALPLPQPHLVLLQPCLALPWIQEVMELMRLLLCKVSPSPGFLSLSP